MLPPSDKKRSLAACLASLAPVLPPSDKKRSLAACLPSLPPVLPPSDKKRSLVLKQPLACHLYTIPHQGVTQDLETGGFLKFRGSKVSYPIYKNDHSNLIY